MIKLGIEIKQGITDPSGKSELEVKLVDPTKKQLETATENEKVVAQKIKNIFDEKIIYLLEENN
ncbi:MAG: hypothetical protein IIZ67_05395 [Bacilli bacterium]|nr:hypothetical protein [Bacilli bacterium]